MLGNGRLEALCFDGEKRLAHIRGKLRKKVWINQGDIILLSLRDYQDEKGDVILKYSADEARSLKAYGELPESAKINETDTYVYLFVCAFIQAHLFKILHLLSLSPKNPQKANPHSSPHSYGNEGIDDNVEFDEDRDGSDDDKEIDVDEI